MGLLPVGAALVTRPLDVHDANESLKTGNERIALLWKLGLDVFNGRLGVFLFFEVAHTLSTSSSLTSNADMSSSEDYEQLLFWYVGVYPP